MAGRTTGTGVAIIYGPPFNGGDEAVPREVRGDVRERVYIHGQRLIVWGQSDEIIETRLGGR